MTPFMYCWWVNTSEVVLKVENTAGRFATACRILLVDIFYPS
jgi:hypothetical protein